MELKDLHPQIQAGITFLTKSKEARSQNRKLKSSAKKSGDTARVDQLSKENSAHFKRETDVIKKLNELHGEDANSAIKQYYGDPEKVIDPVPKTSAVPVVKAAGADPKPDSNPLDATPAPKKVKPDVAASDSGTSKLLEEARAENARLKAAAGIKDTPAPPKAESKSTKADKKARPGRWGGPAPAAPKAEPKSTKLLDAEAKLANLPAEAAPAAPKEAAKPKIDTTPTIAKTVKPEAAASTASTIKLESAANKEVAPKAPKVADVKISSSPPAKPSTPTLPPPTSKPVKFSTPAPPMPKVDTSSIKRGLDIEGLKLRLQDTPTEKTILQQKAQASANAGATTLKREADLVSGLSANTKAAVAPKAPSVSKYAGISNTPDIGTPPPRNALNSVPSGLTSIPKAAPIDPTEVMLNAKPMMSTLKARKAGTTLGSIGSKLGATMEEGSALGRAGELAETASKLGKLGKIAKVGAAGLAVYGAIQAVKSIAAKLQED